MLHSFFKWYVNCKVLLKCKVVLVLDLRWVDFSFLIVNMKIAHIIFV